MKVGLVAFLMVAGAIVWIFAAIGALAVARAVGGGPAASQQPVSLLAQSQADAPGVDVAELPRYAGSIRSEYRSAVWDDLIVTEVEYRTPDGSADVLAHYRETFAAAGWQVDGRDFRHGEWSYHVSLGDRVAEVEIERLDDVTEIEVEVTEPAYPRGPGSAR